MITRVWARPMSALKVLGALMVLALMPVDAKAFSSTVTQRKEYLNGTAKIVEMAGTFRLSGGERIQTVRVTMMDSNRRDVSSAMGTVDRQNHTWKGSVGDFRGVYYRADFYLTDPNGRNLHVVSSSVYVWTGR